MKVVALVSGGKDSCFNILHCLANDHELIALANLMPLDPSVQELDSFMFQTVGHDVLSYYSECIGVPMYRETIKGSSKNQDLDYKNTQDDEIEDLFNLLSLVKSKHPDVEAVSVGAILSSYQRTRVENVCQRLGLTSLAYLWQRNQLELMTEMVESSMDAILIKVAAIGLNQSHLGKSLKQIFPVLLNLNTKFDVHICGEGGEFESLVLDAPFFVRKLKVVEVETFTGNDDVSYLKPVVEVIEKHQDEDFHSVKELNVDWKKYIPTNSSLLNEKFQDIYDLVKDDTLTSIITTDDSPFTLTPKNTVKSLGNSLFVSNLTSDKITVEEQVEDVFNQLDTILNEYKIDSSHIQHSTLLIASMSNFIKINSIYVKFFQNPLPPSRVCVQTKLPAGAHLQLSTTILLDSKKKTGLHVQGRSYWAPANIGPYSQSIINENLTATLSGQIPLIPSSMDLSPHNDIFNSVLSLQHFDNVKQVIGCINQLSTVSFVKSPRIVGTIAKLWQYYSGEFDPEDVLIIVQVEELPKGANAEWGGLSYKTIQNLYEDDSADEEDVSIPDGSDQNLLSQHKANNGEIVSNLALTIDEFTDFQFNENSHYSIYTRPENISQHSQFSNHQISIDYIPVLNIWNHKGELKDYGIVIRQLQARDTH